MINRHIYVNIMVRAYLKRPPASNLETSMVTVDLFYLASVAVILTTSWFRHARQFDQRSVKRGFYVVRMDQSSQKAFRLGMVRRPKHYEIVHSLPVKGEL